MSVTTAGLQRAPAQGILILSWFTGLHEDYHRPSDSAEKIDYRKMEKITRDHSPVGELEDSQKLSEDAAMRHPRRSEVYRDLGSMSHTPNDTEFVEIYIRARLRNLGSRVAKQCRPYLVKLEEVHPSGTTPTTYFDSLVLRWPRNDYEPRDIPRGIDQFFDVVGVLTSAGILLLPKVGNFRFKMRDPLLSSLHLSACRTQCVE